MLFSTLRICVDAVSEAVTVTVVEKEVVRLVEVVAIVVTMTESLEPVAVSLDIVTRDYTQNFLSGERESCRSKQ